MCYLHSTHFSVLKLGLILIVTPEYCVVGGQQGPKIWTEQWFKVHVRFKKHSLKIVDNEGKLK